MSRLNQATPYALTGVSLPVSDTPLFLLRHA